MTRIDYVIVFGILIMINVATAAIPPTSSQSQVEKCNQFASDLYSRMSQTQGNICISPYGVSSALSLAASGAEGKTSEQILSLLHWTMDGKDLPAAQHALTQSIVTPTVSVKADDQAQITIANAMFGQRQLAYRQQYLDLLADQYGAPLKQVDFSGQPQQACDQINQWAADQTHDKIKQIVPRSAITAQSRLILLNAIYLKAAWLHTFSKTATADEPFHLDESKSVPVPLMQQQRDQLYLQTPTFQAVELPYIGDFSMLIALPTDPTGINALEKQVTAAGLTDWIGKLTPQLVRTYLPRFRMECSYQLKSDLQSLGMTDAFDATKADFSGMVSTGGIHIDRVMQKTFISVDEAGTEAAAVTAITMRASAMAPRQKPVEPIIFRADHPFLFFLRHQPTGALLFMGRVNDPR